MTDDVLQFFVNGLAYGAQLGMLAAGFGLVYTVRRVFHVFYGATFALAAYASVWAITLAHAWLWVGLVAAIAIAVLANVLVEFAAYRGLKVDGSTEGASVPISLACYVIAVALMSLSFGSAPVGLSPGLKFASFRFFQATVSIAQLASILLGVMIAILAWHLRRSVAGLALRAVADDVTIAESVGLSARMVGVGALLVSGVLAGVAAWCYAIDGSVEPTIGARAIIIGAFGLLAGAKDVVGIAAITGLLIGIIQHVSAVVVPGPWREPLAFAVVGILAVIWRLTPKMRAG